MKKSLLILTTICCTFLYTNAQNKALQINADGSFFVCPTFQQFTSTSVTFEAWVKLNPDTAIDNYTAVLDGRYGDLSDSKALIFKNLNDEVTTSFEWEGAWGYEAGEGENIVQTGAWQHLALVVDGASQTATFYINGNPGGSRAAGDGAEDYGNIGAEVSWDTLFIGNSNGSDSPERTVIGELDELRVWSTARTQAEITENMNSEIAPTAGLMAYYTCDEDPGATTLTDASGNGNDAMVAEGGEDFAFVENDNENWEPLSVGNNMQDILSIAPNPVVNTLQINGVNLANADYKIYSITGELIEQSALNSPMIDVSNFEQGMYLIELNVNNKVVSKKFVKQ